VIESAVFVLSGGEVLLQGATLRLVAGLVGQGLAARRRDGYRPSAMELEVTEALRRAAAMSRPGHADVPEAAPERSSGQAISSAEAARILEVSPRQVRRLTGELGGRRTVAGPLEFDLAAIEAEAARRQQQRKDNDQ
jgi:hypothetical protein